MDSQTEPLRPFASCHDHPKRRTCMLMVTHGCNLNCTYCYEKFKNGAKRMDIALAKEIIRKEIDIVKNDERFDELEVDFMGGEPLLRFDLIKEVVEWMERHCDIPFVCFATTNATLLNNENKSWLREHYLTMVLGASYDGVAGNSQSINRGEATMSVDWDFFRTTWPTQPFKMTISKESLPYLCDSHIEAERKNYYVVASLAHGVEWDVKDAIIYREQLQKLAEFYLKHPNLSPCELLTRPLSGIGEKVDSQIKFCGSGTYMATYDTDGTMYGCHMFTPLVLGTRALKHSDFTGWDNEQELTDPSCKGCGFMHWCPTCIGFNLLVRNKIHLRDHRWCAMNAAQALSACEFQINYFSRFAQNNTLRDREIRILQDALSAYSYLSNIDMTKSFPQ